MSSTPEDPDAPQDQSGQDSGQTQPMPNYGYPQQPPQPAYGYPTGPQQGYQQGSPGYPAGPPQGYQQGYPQGAYAGGYYSPPNHPRAGTALALGLISVIGMFFCVIPVVVSPFAWAIGRSTLRDIRSSPTPVGGEGQARAGMILGIIGTVILVLAIIGIALLVIVVVADPHHSVSFDSGTSGA